MCSYSLRSAALTTGTRGPSKHASTIRRLAERNHDELRRDFDRRDERLGSEAADGVGLETSRGQGLGDVQDALFVLVDDEHLQAL